jgi:hypothetical protein
MRCHNDNFVAAKAKLIVAYPMARVSSRGAREPVKRLPAAIRVLDSVLQAATRDRLITNDQNDGAHEGHDETRRLPFSVKPEHPA